MSTLFWCPGCGMVWTADEPPICKHNIPPTLAHPPRRMDPLFAGHPFARPLGEAEGAQHD